ncbi:MAG: hypothetical protein GY862_09575 [Gammaproteobacteria bacterium]|nr:hypothetical protein [Gammaproteobacteria bacterium]
MTYFNWLHLTDLHQGMEEWRWPGARESFFEDLKRLHGKYGPWDLVLFSGDLTLQGSSEEFNKADGFLKRLWDFLEGDPVLLAVPGNHDLVRPESKDPIVRLLKMWENQPDIREEFWDDAQSPYRRTIEKAFENYSAWQENQAFKPKNLQRGLLPGDFSVSIEKEGAELGIVGLNTAFLQLSEGDYQKKLALHARQFHEACGGDGSDWAKQHHACLLLTHHSPDWLDPDSQRHLQAEIVAHGRFAAHLCGHLHQAAAGYRNIAESGTETKCLWQGRSLFGLESFTDKKQDTLRLHGYTAGRIELNENEKEGKLIFWPREARVQGGQREITPDFSLNLTDEQHTRPKSFPLLQPYPITRIFLAKADGDLAGQHDKLKRYLENLDSHVMVLPRYSPQSAEIMEAELKKCVLFVQLLNGSDETGSDKIGPRLQHQCARAAGLRILQWCDPGVDVNAVEDDTLRAFLKSDTVMISPLAEFQQYLEQQLTARKECAAAVQVVITREMDRGEMVFINAAPEDRELALKIKAYLDQHGFGCVLPLPNASKPKKDLRRNYLISDVLLVLYGEAAEEWVRDQLYRCHKLEEKRKKPLKLNAVYNKPLTDKPSLGMSLPGMVVLKCPEPEASDCLPHFVKAMKP